MPPTKRSRKKHNEAQEVRRRLVLNFPGFEQTDALRQIGRLQRGGKKTGEIWGFGIEPLEAARQESDHHGFASFLAKGKNWHTEMELVQFRWNDIVHAYERDTFPGGFLKNLKKYFAFFGDGTVWEYRKASGRYFAFTIFPLLLAAVFFLACWLAIWSITASVWINAMVCIALTLGFCKWPGDKLYIPITIADWGFARDMIFRSNPEIEARFEEFAALLVDEISKSDHDEIVMVGHSFGSLWAVGALARALKKEPKLLKGKHFAFLALGSSMLKLALAPKAGHIRDDWQKVMNDPAVFWYEVQTKDDLIAFYKCDPFKAAKIEVAKNQYAIDRIRFSKGMETSRYRQMRWSFYRTHRQYILYYDKRVSFDYMLRLFGPLSARTLATQQGVTNHIDQNGCLS